MVLHMIRFKRLVSATVCYYVGRLFPVVEGNHLYTVFCFTHTLQNLGLFALARHDQYEGTCAPGISDAGGYLSLVVAYPGTAVMPWDD